jgi:hypothetical protein
VLAKRVENVQLQVAEQLTNFRVLFLKTHLLCLRNYAAIYSDVVMYGSLACGPISVPASSLHAEEVTPHKSHTTESLQCSGHG